MTPTITTPITPAGWSPDQVGDVYYDGGSSDVHQLDPYGALASSTAGSPGASRTPGKSSISDRDAATSCGCVCSSALPGPRG